MSYGQKNKNKTALTQLAELKKVEKSVITELD